MAQQIIGRYGRFTPKPYQAAFYAPRAKRQAAQRRQRATQLSAWLDKHRACANGCGQPVAFYDTVHYALKHSGCCSSQCEQAHQQFDVTAAEEPTP